MKKKIEREGARNVGARDRAEVEAEDNQHKERNAEASEFVEHHLHGAQIRTHKQNKNGL